MRFQRIIEQVYHRPWMITAEGHASIHQIIQSKLLNSDTIKAEGDLGFIVNKRRELEIQSHAGRMLAIIDVRGILAPNLSMIERSCGNTDYSQIITDIEQAKAQGAQGIIYTIDSPGGSCAGSTECATAIAESSLPSVAAVETQCCSAGYMLAAGCGAVFAPKSSLVGSIGTIIARLDSTGAWEQMGIKPDFITNDEGDLKSAGHGPSIDDEQRAYLQELVNDSFAQFRDHVEAFREIEPWAMRGQAMLAPRALKANLIDSIGGLSAARTWLIGQL